MKTPKSPIPSWHTVRQSITKLTREQLEDMLATERKTVKRAYIISRLISAATNKYRQELCLKKR
jgi:hypothetical protein